MPLHRIPSPGCAGGIYTGPANSSVYPAYQQASGHNKRLLAKIALRPLMYSFGAWNPDDQIGSNVQQLIANDTGGDPSVLSQVAVFRLDPWEGAACPNGSWSASDQASYRTWIDNFASAIGSSRVALVLQPDLAFAACARSHAPLELVSYAARRFSALPRTTVYIDGGVHYWPSFNQAVWMLEQAGVGYARGFALNTTEYDSTGAELEYGAGIAQGLPQSLRQDLRHARHPADDRRCQPPVGPVWLGSRSGPALRRRLLWVGRPWLDNGAYPFDLRRALGLAASEPLVAGAASRGPAGR